MAGQVRETVKLYSHAAPRSMAPPLWLWPNLLSLDAPVIAVLWQVFFCLCLSTRVSAAGLAVLFLCTWTVYAGDRLLDGLTPGVSPDTARHRFYRVHRRATVLSMAAVAAAAIYLVLTRFSAGLIRSYLELTAFVAGYLLAVHAAPPRRRRFFPKEPAVAVFFAAGILLPEWSAAGFRLPTLGWLAGMAAVILLNVRGIEHWEGRRPARYLRTSAMVLAGLGFTAIGLPWLPAAQRPLCAALAVSALLLAALDAGARRLSPELVRVLADAALLVPLLFLL